MMTQPMGRPPKYQQPYNPDKDHLHRDASGKIFGPSPFLRSFVFNLVLIIILSIIIFMMFGCQRGKPTTKPPIHLNPNMDSQPKYEAQEASKFFTDGASGRLPVDGTVAKGRLRDDPYFTGMKPGTEEYIEKIPVEMTQSDLERGQERFEIYCLMCHGPRGIGDGIVIEKGMFQPPSYHDDKIKEFTAGQIFSTITNGARNMQSYKQQIPVDDRWRIVHYVRHLQQSGPGVTK